MFVSNYKKIFIIILINPIKKCNIFLFYFRDKNIKEIVIDKINLIQYKFFVFK